MPSCHKHSEASYCDLILEILETVKPEPFLKLELDMLFFRAAWSPKRSTSAFQRSSKRSPIARAWQLRHWRVFGAVNFWTPKKLAISTRHTDFITNRTPPWDWWELDSTSALHGNRNDMLMDSLFVRLWSNQICLKVASPHSKRKVWSIIELPWYVSQIDTCKISHTSEHCSHESADIRILFWATPKKCRGPETPEESVGPNHLDRTWT